MATMSFEKICSNRLKCNKNVEGNFKKAYKITTNNREHESDRVKGIAVLR